jgi:hypothetical protein
LTTILTLVLDAFCPLTNCCICRWKIGMFSEEIRRGTTHLIQQL